THFSALVKSALAPDAKPGLQAMVAAGYVKRKNNLLAARLFAEAHAKDPKSLEGRRDAVISVYEAKNMELAGTLAEKYLAKDDDREIRGIQVDAYTATNKPPEKLRAAIKGLSGADSEAGSKMAMRLAKLDLAVRDTAAAIENAGKWLDRNPKDAEGWRFLLSLAAKRPGQEEAHIASLEKLVQLEPASSGRYHLELGELYLKKGNYEDAEKSLLSASKASPANAGLWFRLGETQMKLRKEKEAAEKFQRAHLLDRGNIAYARAFSASL